MPDDHTARAMTPADRIATDLRERIAAGEFRPGDHIPSEAQIVEQWRVAKMTAARAVGRLRSAGLVETLPGRGTVVRERRAAVSPADQLARMTATGRIRLPNERTDVVQTGVASAATLDPVILGALGLTVESGPALYRRRVVYRDDIALCVATSWFADTMLGVHPRWAAARERLLAYDVIPEGTPMVVAGVVDEEPEQEQYVASAEIASTMESDLLRLQVGAAVLRVFTTMRGREWPLEAGAYTYPAGTPVDFPAVRV